MSMSSNVSNSSNTSNQSYVKSSGDTFVNYASSKVDDITAKLKKIDETLINSKTKKSDDVITSAKSSIIEIENQITETVKILKRSLKGENQISVITHIEQSLSRLDAHYHNTLQLLQSTEQSTNVTTRTTEVGRILHDIDEVKQRATKKIELLNHRSSFEINKLERFDRLLDTKNSLSSTLAIIISNIQLKNGTIMDADYAMLNYFYKHPEKLNLKAVNNNIDEFKTFIKELITQIETTAQRKHNLLKNILKEVEAKTQPLSEEDQIKYTIQYRQIINNPLEISLDKNLSTLGPEYFDNSNLTNKLSGIIPDLETRKIAYSDSTCQYKLEGLKKIQQEAKNSAKNSSEGGVLISGAGPGGLMCGLITSLQGKQLTIIESRKENDATSRNNVLALGKDDLALPMLKTKSSTGQYDEADLKLLDFFGVTDRLISEGLATYEKPSKSAAPFAAKIGDLQRAMQQNLQELESKKESVITYECRIESIKPGEPGKPGEPKKPAKVKLTNERLETPSVVYVMEGYRASTRDLLGIDTVKQSKAALVGVSFFDVKKGQTIQEKFVLSLKKLTDGLRAVPDFLKLSVKNFFADPHLVKDHEKVFNALGRAELLLKTPGNAYFYFSLTSDEVDIINKSKSELAIAQKSRDRWADEVEAYINVNSKNFTGPESAAATALKDQLKKSNRKKWYTDPVQSQKVFNNIQILSNALSNGNMSADASNFSTLAAQFATAVDEAVQIESSYHQIKEEISKKISKPGRRRMDLFLPGSSSHASYTTSDMVASQVQRAETNYRKMGLTHFYVGGDAESTTDPVSGAGFRTTILRTTIATNAFENPELRNNPFMQSAFEWGSNRSALDMREEGLTLRNAYLTGTERLERYLDVGEESNALSHAQREFLLKIEGKFKSMRDFNNPELKLNPTELSELKIIQKQLTEKYESQEGKCITNGQWDKLFKFKDVGLTAGEEEMFLKAWNSATKGTNVHTDPTFDMEIFKNAAAKMALQKTYNYTVNLDRINAVEEKTIFLPETWYVTLMTFITQFQNESV